MDTEREGPIGDVILATPPFPALHAKGSKCTSCGQRIDLRCEDCGCPMTCHDWIAPYPNRDMKMPYCAWDGPCWKERRPLFIEAVLAWMEETRMVKHLVN